MISYKRILLPLMTSAALLFGPLAYADMVLDSDNSTLSFVSIKKDSVAEVHMIKKLSGSLSKAGELKIVLDLFSVDTKIEIRDGRMKELLFETNKFAEATLTAKVEGIPEDGIKHINTKATLDLHGVSQTVNVDVTVLKIGDKLIATNSTPIIINAADFKLDAGIKKLKELAKLPSIATAVPVNFTLVFSK